MAVELDNPLFDFGIEQWLSEPDVAFDAFLSGYRFNERRLRASSFRIYKGMFGRLREWALAQGLSLFDLKAASIEQFLGSRGLSAETRHRYLLLFTSLFEHLAHIRAGEAELPSLSLANPARTLLLEREAPSREDPDFMNMAEVRRFVDALPASSNWKRLRDRAMALMVLGAGLTSSEVLRLRVSDLRFKSGALEGVWIPAHKPRPERQAPIQFWARPYVEAWLQERESLCRGDSSLLRALDRPLVGSLLFPSNLAGAPLKAVTLFRLVKTALDRAGVVKRYEGPMLLRNSCGALWLHQHELLQVSLWMGHATVRYTELLLPPNLRKRH